MKHVFLINPVAGYENAVNKLTSIISGYKDTYDILIHVTTDETDACKFSREYSLSHPDEDIRFYSCGGDGTLGEVVNGIVGIKNASVTCFPCGSGNDFVKSLGGKERFLDIEKLFNAKVHQLDLIKVNDYYSLNVVNVGFDARVCKHANLLKGKSKNPYTAGIFKALRKGLITKVFIEIDGEVVNPSGKILLSNFANGGYMGGKFFCNPNFVIDDGIIEFTMIKPTNLLNFAYLIKKYERGEHFNSKGFKKLLYYKQVKKARIFADTEFDLCIDGEMLVGKEFNLEVVPKAINFAIPE